MLLEGKNGLILGVANKRSIAWGIAKACAREGARLALTYQGERLKENVDELSKDLKDPLLYPCDVGKDEDIAALAASVRADLGSLDFGAAPDGSFVRAQSTLDDLAIERFRERRAVVRSHGSKVATLEIPDIGDKVRCRTLLSGRRAILGTNLRLYQFP